MSVQLSDSRATLPVAAPVSFELGDSRKHARHTQPAISRFAGRRRWINNDDIRIMRNWLCALWLLLAATAPSWAASGPETRAFEAAAKAFTDGGWEYAERKFGAFLQEYPKSEHRAEAALLQAQARYNLADFRRAIELLTAEQAGAGPLAEQYAMWIGHAQFQSTNYVAAAGAYRFVVTNFPTSKLRLEASVNEAVSWAGLKEWGRVEELLSEPTGAFQQLALTAPTSELVVRGGLVLAEARLARGNLAAAEAGLRKIDGRGLPPALAWRQSFLLCRALLGRALARQVLENSSNLLALARATAQPALLAESLALQASALEELGQLEKAADTYSQNLVPAAPVELQRQALLKLGELALVRGRLEDAAQTLEDFLQRHTNSPACDMALLTLGELHLNQHVAALAGGTTNAAPTNALAVALASFEALRERFPKSPLLGKAELDRGWCLWLTNDITGSAAAFGAAAQALPSSYDQAVARFKLADAQFQQRQFDGAISNYSAVVALAEVIPAVKTNLCEPALYQIVRAGTEITNSAATEAAGRLLEWFPESYVTESALLMAGQGQARHGDPAAARQSFEDLLKRFPNSEHTALVRLEVARTHELQRNWTSAVQEYQGWLTAFPTNAERPRAEYALALASYQAGDETNALTRFTNFVALHATNALAPQAQWWLADYHFRRGEAVEAEKNYQLIFQTWSNSPLAFEARMMAGRTAVKRQGWASAIDYFTNLTSNPNCPDNLKVQAIFAYGDALRRADSSETNNPANLEEAIKVFRKVHDLNATNAAAACAWGEIGNCYYQLGAQDPNQYTNATVAFRQVGDAPWADVAARSQAHVGLGLVAEKLAARESGESQTRLLKEALNHHLDVLYETQLRDGERSDAFWLKRAGLEAARLAESLQEWTQALRIYERLQVLLPPLKPKLDEKIAKARERLPR